MKARRALIALKGVVKLQALVRGQNVRKQTKLTLKCMEALVRVQDQVRYQRARLSLESSRKSMFAETSGFFTGSRCLDHIFDRKSIVSSFYFYFLNIIFNQIMLLILNFIVSAIQYKMAFNKFSVTHSRGRRVVVLILIGTIARIRVRRSKPRYITKRKLL